MNQQILIIDDDPDTRVLLQRLFKNSTPRPTIYSAGDPVEGLNLYHKYKNSLTHVICDHYMPIENGLELCKIIKENSPDIRIIMYSADENLKKNNKIFYVDAFLVKPHDIKRIQGLL